MGVPMAALGQDVLHQVASYLHPIDLAHLALCTQSLLLGCELSAALLARRYMGSPEANASAEGEVTGGSSSSRSRSWRLRYLCAFEVAGVEDHRLKTVLRQMYAGAGAAVGNNTEGGAPAATATSTTTTTTTTTPSPAALQHLNLYGLNIGDAGAERLALALRVARAYRVLLLNLGGNNLSDRGAQAVVQALKRHHHEVNTLFLAQNKIGVNGARCVADLISSSANLRSLSLSDNPLMDEGAVCITGALPESSSLATLSMRCASFSSQAREGIRSSWGGRGGDKVFGLYI